MSRPRSCVGPGGTSHKTGNTVVSRGRGNLRAKSAGGSLKAKEEEYRRRNEELEAKTASLVREAEDIMRQHNSLLSDEEQGPEIELLEQHQASDAHPSVADVLGTHPEALSLGEPSQPESMGISREVKKPHKKQPSATRPKTTLPTTDVLPHHELNDRPHTTEKSLSMDIEKTVRLLEQRLEEEEERELMEGDGRGGGGGGGGRREGQRGYRISADVVPEVAEEMGTEAMIRFLKAKVRVLQEEVETVSAENHQKEKQLVTAEAELKELREKYTKLDRGHQSMQSQIMKYKKLSTEQQQKCEGLEGQLVALRRENESLKSAQRKTATGKGALEVRLDRALEEAEKYKMLLNRVRADSKDATKQERLRIEELEARNKQLERQKSELIAGFKKQMKLIDLLKRQKVHIEAARLLSFTEEEFIKSLDWDAT